MEIFLDQEKKALMLLQTAHLKVVLEQFRMSDCNPRSTIINSGLSNIIMPSWFGYQTSPEIIFWYASAVESLVYSMTMTWLDIAFALSIFSRYCNNPDSTNFAAVIQIFQYIKGTLDDSIIFWGEPDKDWDFIMYTNIDYRSAIKEQKSISR